MNRSIAPEIKTAFGLSAPEYQSIQFSNGAPAYLFEDKSTSAVKLSLLFNTGSKYNAYPFQATAMAAVWQQGPEGMSATVFSETIDRYGAFLSINAGYEFTEITLHFLEKHSASLLPLIKDLIQNPAFDPAEVEIDKKARFQRIASELQKTSFTASAHFNRMVYGENHPLGNVATPEQTTQSTRESLVDFFQNKVKNNLHCMVLAGGITEELLTALQQTIGFIPVNKTSIEGSAPAPTGEKRFFYLHSAANQNTIIIGRPIFSRFHPDFAEMRVVVSLLGGYFGSRLMSNLREDKGFTYGVSAYMNVHANSGQLIIRTDVGSEVTSAAINEIYKELEALRNNLVDTSELELVCNYLNGTYLRSVDGCFPQAELMNRLLCYGIGKEAIQKNLQALKTITPNRVQELANLYFNPADFIESVSGAEF